MDYEDSIMSYAYLVGYMDGVYHNATYSFSEWINEANQIIDRMDIKMNDGQFEDLIDIYNGSGKTTKEINDIMYIIVGEFDDDDDDADIDDLYGIVYIEDDNIKLISLTDFNNLKKMEKDEDALTIDFSEIVYNEMSFSPSVHPVAELIKKYKEFLIDKLDIVNKYHYTYGFKDLKIVLELDRFGNDEFWDEEDSDEECNEDDEEIVLCKCCICDKWKFIDDIVCIQIQPDKIWKCCDCIAVEVQMKRVNIFQRLVNKNM